MKNYPLLFNTNKAWIAWTQHYLNELNEQVYGLLSLSEKLYADYRFNNSEKDIEKYITGSNDTLYYYINVAKLSYHTYYQSLHNAFLWTKNTEPTYEDLIQQPQVSSGAYIISYAQDEGENDSEFGKISRNLAYYSTQPAGWASFYLWYFIGNHFKLDFDQYAEENFGLTQIINFNMFTDRYFNLQSASLLNNVNSFVLLNSRDKDTSQDLIIDRQNLLWTNATSNPLMYFAYSAPCKVNEQTFYGEEIIADLVFDTSIVAKSNIATYTIKSRENKKEWPQSGIYIDII